MRASRFIKILFVTGLTALVSLLSAQGQPTHDYVEGEVLVRFKVATTLEALRQTASRHSAELAHHYRLISKRRSRTCGLLRSSSKTTATLIAELRKDPSVELVEPNYLRRTSGMRTPNDPHFQHLWGLENTGQSVNGYSGTPGADIHFLSAWGMARASTNERVIAVIDTGVDYTHPDLTNSMWTHSGEIPGNGIDDDSNGYVDDVYGYDFADNDSDPMDVEFHGTHVAGTAAAPGGNGLGVVGAGFQARIMALKASSNADVLSSSAVIEALEYAALMKQAGVNIVAINASYGGPSFSTFERNAIEDAGDAGIIFCTAAGNETNNNDTLPNYPANYNLANIITVAATDQDDDLATFSNYGASSVDLAAPGVNILSTWPVSIGGTDSHVQQGLTTYEANEFIFSGTTTGITATIYDCGLGSPADFPPAVNGNIALMERGDLLFSEKAANAMAAGAVAAIIYNHSEGNVNGTLGSPGNWIPSVSISRADGLTLLTTLPAIGTVVNNPDPDAIYHLLDGTSMAAPHVAGAVAFAAINFPDETVSQRVQRILTNVTVLTNLSGKISTRGRLNLERIVDTDANGLPDWWERTFYGQLTGTDPNSDSDNDQMNALAEWRAGTNPTNALSHLSLTAVAGSGTNSFAIQWPSVEGKYYRLLRATNLAQGFNEIVSSNITATAPMNSLTGAVSGSVPAHFYKLQLE